MTAPHKVDPDEQRVYAILALEHARVHFTAMARRQSPGSMGVAASPNAVEDGDWGHHIVVARYLAEQLGIRRVCVDYHGVTIVPPIDVDFDFEQDLAWAPLLLMFLDLLVDDEQTCYTCQGARAASVQAFFGLTQGYTGEELADLWEAIGGHHLERSKEAEGQLNGAPAWVPQQGWWVKEEVQRHVLLAALLFCEWLSANDPREPLLGDLDESLSAQLERHLDDRMTDLGMVLSRFSASEPPAMWTIDTIRELAQGLGAFCALYLLSRGSHPKLPLAWLALQEASYPLEDAIAVTATYYRLLVRTTGGSSNDEALLAQLFLGESNGSAGKGLDTNE